MIAFLCLVVLTIHTDRIRKPIIPVTARIAINLDLFKHVVEHGAAISSTKLASLSGGEELLISTCSLFT